MLIKGQQFALVSFCCVCGWQHAQQHHIHGVRSPCGHATRCPWSRCCGEELHMNELVLWCTMHGAMLCRPAGMSTTAVTHRPHVAVACRAVTHRPAMDNGDPSGYRGYDTYSLWQQQQQQSEQAAPGPVSAAATVASPTTAPVPDGGQAHGRRGKSSHVSLLKRLKHLLRESCAWRERCRHAYTQRML